MRQVVPSDDDVSNCNTLTKEAGNDKTSTMRPRGERPVSDNESAGSSEAPGTVLDRVKDQFGGASGAARSGRKMGVRPLVDVVSPWSFSGAPGMNVG